MWSYSASVLHAVMKLTCCWNPETSALTSLQPTSCHTFWASYFVLHSFSLWLYFGWRVWVKKENWMINKSATIMPALICWYKGTCLCIPSCPLPFLCLSIVSGSESSCAGSLDALKISVDLPAKREHPLNEHPSNITSPIPLHKKMPGHRRSSQVRFYFEASVPWAACLKQNHNSHRVFSPLQLLGPKHANWRRQNRQIDGVQGLRESQLTKHCCLTR